MSVLTAGYCSGISWLQSADAALCLTGPGQESGIQLEMRRERFGEIVRLRRLNDDLLAVLPSLWPDLWKLVITGEQRRHLQATCLRVEQGMKDTE